jgi:polar amino acid transport system substrate-binding protein
MYKHLIGSALAPRLFLLLTLFFCTFKTVALIDSEHLSNACDEVIISAHPDYAPFHWEQDGEIIGASIDITGQILNEMGIAWRSDYVGPWKRVLQQAYAGHIDLIPALKKTNEREQFLNYTNAHFYSNPVAVYQKASAETQPIHSLDALDGLIGSVNAGDNHGEQIDAFLSVQDVVEVKGLRENFELLARGRTDYFVIGKQTANAFLQTNKMLSQFEIVLETNNAVVHHGFSKRSACSAIIDEFDKRLQLKLDNGEVEFAIEQYKNKWLERQLLDE